MTVALLLAATQASFLPAEVIPCRLEHGSGRFAVACPDLRADGPIEWLMPPADVEAEEDDYVSSFRFGPEAAAIPLGGGFFALHVASYDVMTEGSAAAGAGRDVFFMFDPTTGATRPAGPSLGLTRERMRVDGCVRAVSHRFFVADVNGDDRLDLGVEREELLCRTEDSDEAVSPRDRGPFDCPQPVRWHVFGNGQWTASPKHEGAMPATVRELPLLGITRTPVDFVRSLSTGIRPCPPSR